MADVTVIGRGASVVGRITGAIDLAIHGRVEGDVSVDGEVTVESEGLIAANVAGRRLIIRGAVKGDVTGAEAVRLEEGARVVGDIRAPRVAVTRGALVRGYVQTHSGATAASPSRAAAKPARPAISSSAAEGPASRVASPPVAPARRAPARALAPTIVEGSSPKAVVAKGPPPPVVPVLRKGAKGSLKKRVG